MSVRKEPSGRRSVQVEVEVDGTPEQVWEAIASGPGVSAWFVPVDIETDNDGNPVRVVSHIGPGMDAIATPTEWDPPRKFAATSADLGPNAPAFATEWTVEALSGDRCRVRVVHSLFASTDDWDNQLESIESGWPGFFTVLRLYLAYYRGQEARSVSAMAMMAMPEAEAWPLFMEKLGIGATAVGQQVETQPGTPRLAGIIDRTGEGRHANAFAVHLSEPGPGVALFSAMGMGPRVLLMMRMYLYGPTANAKAEQAQADWSAFMREQSSPQAMASGPISC